MSAFLIMVKLCEYTVFLVFSNYYVYLTTCAIPDSNRSITLVMQDKLMTLKDFCKRDITLQEPLLLAEFS